MMAASSDAVDLAAINLGDLITLEYTEVDGRKTAATAHSAHKQSVTRVFAGIEVTLASRHAACRACAACLCSTCGAWWVTVSLQAVLSGCHYSAGLRHALAADLRALLALCYTFLATVTRNALPLRSPSPTPLLS